MLKSPYICPKCGGREFLTTAHVAQTWKVDGNGNFIECISTDETTHEPCEGNIWTCTRCGEEGVQEHTLSSDELMKIKYHNDTAPVTVRIIGSRPPQYSCGYCGAEPIGFKIGVCPACGHRLDWSYALNTKKGE